MEIQVQLSELIRDPQLEWLRQVALNCLKVEASDLTGQTNLADRKEDGNGKISI